jgi:hypothetical protein
MVDIVFCPYSILHKTCQTHIGVEQLLLCFSHQTLCSELEVVVHTCGSPSTPGGWGRWIVNLKAAWDPVSKNKSKNKQK